MEIYLILWVIIQYNLIPSLPLPNTHTSSNCSTFGHWELFPVGSPDFLTQKKNRGSYFATKVLNSSHSDVLTPLQRDFAASLIRLKSLSPSLECGLDHWTRFGLKTKVQKGWRVGLAARRTLRPRREPAQVCLPEDAT